MSIKFEVVKNVTLPILKLEQGKTVYVKIEDYKERESVEVDKKTGEQSTKTILIADVVNLETGENMQIVVSSVLNSVLSREYLNMDFIGRNFAITKGEKKGSGANAYFLYSVQEIALTEKGK